MDGDYALVILLYVFLLFQGWLLQQECKRKQHCLHQRQDKAIDDTLAHVGMDWKLGVWRILSVFAERAQHIRSGPEVGTHLDVGYVLRQWSVVVPHHLLHGLRTDTLHRKGTASGLDNPLLPCHKLVAMDQEQPVLAGLGQCLYGSILLLPWSSVAHTPR